MVGKSAPGWMLTADETACRDVRAYRRFQVRTGDRSLARCPYTRLVGWSAPLLTLLGTVVGASVTLFADRVRWRRDRDLRRRDERRTVYGAYLAALHTTSEEIRAV